MTQTISGLACGRPIRGNVAFLGGPLQYLSELRHRFYVTLNLDDEHIIVPENAHLFVATGAALAGESDKHVTFAEVIRLLEDLKDTQGSEVERQDSMKEPQPGRTSPTSSAHSRSSSMPSIAWVTRRVPRSSVWTRSLPPTMTSPSLRAATTPRSSPRASSTAIPAACSSASTPAPPP